MSAADIAHALGDARREGRTWRPLRTPEAHIRDQELPRLS
jgi:hypothetical protein